MAEDEGDIFTKLLVVLSVYFVLVKLMQPKEDMAISSNQKFLTFQAQFVWVYLVMMLADWLQGPTVFELYKHYGFSTQENATLFIAGFGSSMVFGVFAGTLADKYGRKLSCQVYGLTYGLCCITKHFNSYPVLMVGRLLGGFSTSILWSAFESWMVSEHHKRGFEPSSVGSTFSMMIQRNGLVAIASGFMAQGAVWAYGGHPVAPFDLSLACLTIGTLIISFSWEENYGDTQATQAQGVWRAFSAIRNDRKIVLIGVIQSLFEGAMYTFVFAWTPRLQENTANVPFGFVFASFMVSCSIGATIFSYLSRRAKPEEFMFWVFLFASLCMFGAAASSSPLMTMLCFCGFETTVGVFWPSIMSLRSQHLPEEGRATLMNIFRIPLNAIVCLVLANQNALSVSEDFRLCAAAHFICALLVRHLATLTKSAPSEKIVSTDVEMDESV